jgi:hypothetical protein
LKAPGRSLLRGDDPLLERAVLLLGAPNKWRSAERFVKMFDCEAFALFGPLRLTNTLPML